MFHSKTNHIYIGLGANLGDRAGNLLLAARGILDAGLCITRISAVYETEPIAPEPQAAFLNMVAELDGKISVTPEQLMARLLRVEYSLGRRRTALKGPREIDLDLLLFKNETSDTEFLTLPHPRMHQRRFVLVPLAELVPNLVHPTLKKTIAELLETTDDHSEVRRWEP